MQRSKPNEQTGCRQRRDHVSVSDRTSLARRATESGPAFSVRRVLEIREFLLRFARAVGSGRCADPLAVCTFATD